MGRTRLTKCKFLAKFPIGLHVYFTITGKKIKTWFNQKRKIISNKNPLRSSVALHLNWFNGLWFELYGHTYAVSAAFSGCCHGVLPNWTGLFRPLYFNLKASVTCGKKLNDISAPQRLLHCSMNGPLRGTAPWTLFLKILCIFSNNKATLKKVPNGPD